MKHISGSGDEELTEERRQRHLRIALCHREDLKRCDPIQRMQLLERIDYHMTEAAKLATALQFYRQECYVTQ